MTAPTSQNSLFAGRTIPRWITNNLPVLATLLVGLIAGIVIFDDFGASWDEPEYYQYADSTMYAYSISARLEGSYSLEGAFGPADLRYYGPSFLILGKAATTLLSYLAPAAKNIDLWHLSIYLFFLMGGFFFYKLALRWTSTKPAVFSTILFLSQPILFGNAWINPKDIPLMVYFLGTAYFGLHFSDLYEQFLSTQDSLPTLPRQVSEPKPLLAGKLSWLHFSIGLLLLSIVLLASGAGYFKEFVSELILSVNTSSPGSLFDRVFLAMARSINEVPLSYYSSKFTVLYDQALLLWSLLALAASFLLFLAIRRPGWLTTELKRAKHSVSLWKQRLLAAPSSRQLALTLLATCFFLASASATRVVGPLAGALVILIWIIRFKAKSLPAILVCGLLAFVLFYAQWPYIWQDTVKKLVFVIQHMSNNPVGVNALFAGTIYDSRALPITYLPGLLGVTLTEPAIVLILVGIVIFPFGLARSPRKWEGVIVFGWLLIPLAYVIWKRPPMYDNYRHFLFLLPVLFLFAAASFQYVLEAIRWSWLQGLLVLFILLPGFVSLIQLHPFQYSYYNNFTGGVRGADNNYELDYWLTCYKHLGNLVEQNEPGHLNVYVDLNPQLVSLYAYSKISVHSTSDAPFEKGSLIFLPSRWGHASLFNEHPVVYTVELQGVPLCIARRVLPS